MSSFAHLHSSCFYFVRLPRDSASIPLRQYCRATARWYTIKSGRHFSHDAGERLGTRLSENPKMGQRILIYLLRRDLRVADNPILHEISKITSQSQPKFTHVLPIYIFPAQQIEISGFLSSNSEKSPYPEARSQVGNFWRCGALRAKFLVESIWDVKQDLERLGSGLEIRVGTLSDVVRQVLDGFKEQNGESQVTGLWMTGEEGVEERRDEKAVRNELRKEGLEFKLWKDEKYFIDDDDVPFKDSSELPDVFTEYRNMVEPIRNAPRPVLDTPSALLPLPSSIPPQSQPFAIPNNFDGLMESVLKPLPSSLDLQTPPKISSTSSITAHPFRGGSASAHARVRHLLESGAAISYKDTRNGMLGEDFSTKLSAFLALGSITARQIHEYLVDFEEAKTPIAQNAKGYGQGENVGNAHIRYELLWRDYFRLCTRKFGPRLFRKEGFRNAQNITWKYDNDILQRWLEGTTGTGLIDASQRELFLTGYTSNRARQNVASFLAKHLGLDWRYGAEWYECNLIDYDLSSNWGNWQYNSGVGNDPRQKGEGRIFNPVKQASDYDPNGEYIRTWVEETSTVKNSELCWQYWKLGNDPEEVKRLGLEENVGVQSPLVKIDFVVGHRGGSGGKRGRGSGRGGSGGQHHGDRGHRGRGRGRGGSSGRSRGRGFGGHAYSSNVDNTT